MIFVQMLLLPNAANTDRGPVMSLLRRIRIRTVLSAPIPVLHRFAHHRQFTIALRNAYHEPFTAWTKGELDEMVRRKKDKDARPTYNTIARSLQKPAEEVKQAWKVYQQLEARS